MVKPCKESLVCKWLCWSSNVDVFPLHRIHDSWMLSQNMGKPHLFRLFLGILNHPLLRMRIMNADLFSPDDMRIILSRPDLYLLESLVASLSCDVHSWPRHQLTIPEMPLDPREHVGVDEDDVLPSEPPLGVHLPVQHSLKFPFCQPLPWDATGCHPVDSNIEFSWRDFSILHIRC